MASISIFFPSADGASFDYDYLERVHLPLVLSRWGKSGLENIDLFRGVSDAAGSAPAFLAFGILHFATLDHLRAAMTGGHAGEIASDIAKFTNVRPVLQINRKIG